MVGTAGRTGGAGWLRSGLDGRAAPFGFVFGDRPALSATRWTDWRLSGATVPAWCKRTLLRLYAPALTLIFERIRSGKRGADDIPATFRGFLKTIERLWGSPMELFPRQDMGPHAWGYSPPPRGMRPGLQDCPKYTVPSAPRGFQCQIGFPVI